LTKALTEDAAARGAGQAAPAPRVAPNKNSLSLDRLPFGVRARVVAVRGSGAIARRLMEMGIVPGAPVRVIKAAPLGDPIEVRVRGYHLALRRSEARTIAVTVNENGES
jgi:ferrous iron transport protein A